MHCRQYSKRSESVSARLAATWPCVNSHSATGDVSAKRVSRAPGEPSPHQEPTEIRRTFARNLRQAREAAGLLQSEFARIALYDHRHLVDIEVNAGNATLDTITRLAKPLGLTEIDLLLPNMGNGTVKRVSRAAAEPLSKTEPTEFRRTFARNLRQAREAAGLSQRALAKAASCDRQLLMDIEDNAANTTLDTVARLAKALGLTAIDLLLPNMENVTAQRVSLAPEEPLSKTEPTEFRRSFAGNLRQARLAAGMPQRVLARAAAMSLSGVWHIEVNAPNVTLDTVTLLAKQLGRAEIDLLRPKDP